MPDEHKTPELYLWAVQHNPGVMKCVPKSCLESLEWRVSALLTQPMCARFCLFDAKIDTESVRTWIREARAGLRGIGLPKELGAIVTTFL
jgi:hypothetical protein